MTDERPEPNHVVARERFLLLIVKIIDVDEVSRCRKTHVQDRNQALAAGKDFCFIS